MSCFRSEKTSVRNVPVRLVVAARLTVPEGLRLKKTAHALTVGRRKGLVLLFR